MRAVIARPGIRDNNNELVDVRMSPPGLQRRYQIALSSAKKPETRIAPIEKLRPKILAGKGANEYQG